MSQSETSDLLSAMLCTIRRFSMLERGDKVLVAVSGGADSVALLHALHSMRDDLGITLHVAHLNHSFRGDESDADAEYVRQMSADLGLESYVEKIDVPGIQRALRLSPEAAARMVRYEFLERVADELCADRIALGHTADDQVETVLLNLLRGTGVDGLAGMPPVRDRIIRPLIESRRTDIEAYAEHHGVHPRVDATNLLPEYTRNNIRLELLPHLRREFNPEIDSGILRLAELAREDVAYLTVEAETALRIAAIEREETSITLDADVLMSLPCAIRRRSIRQAVKTVKGELANVGFLHVEELLRLLETGSNFDYELPGGSFMRRTGHCLAISSTRPDVTPTIFCYELEIPGKKYVPEIEATVEVEFGFTPVEPRRPQGSPEVVMDAENIVGKLRVRNWEPGDRIQPFGMQGSKKVQDIFVDAKIPRAARHRVPLIVDDEKVVWVADLVLSECVRVTGETTRYFLVRFAYA